MMKREENQTVEHKEAWHDNYLEWICGYANAYGGTLYIGIEDGTKKPVGVAKAHKLSEDIPNKIRDTMGIVADVTLPNLLYGFTDEQLVAATTTTPPVTLHDTHQDPHLDWQI